MHKVQAIAGDWDNVNRLRLVRVDVNGETKIVWQVSTDLGPVVAGIVRAHDVPVLLHEPYARSLRIHVDVVNAVADLGVLIRDVLRLQAAGDRLTCLASVIGTKRARRI